MTYQEALKEFKESLGSGHALMPSHEAWLKAVEAIDKQIPRKYKLNEFGDYICPRCYAWITRQKGANYCIRCGQAIDWSEVEPFEEVGE